MQRRTPMPRSGFKPKGFEPRPAKQMDYTPRPRVVAVAVADTRARMVVPLPKRKYVRSTKLREAYRELPCQFDRDGGGLCARMDGTVCCCHSNWGQHGKGLSIKADDSRAAAGCSQCHAELDQGKRWTEDEKRTRWQAAHERSVRLLVSMGLWPADLEPWPEDEDTTA